MTEKDIEDMVRRRIAEIEQSIVAGRAAQSPE